MKSLERKHGVKDSSLCLRSGITKALIRYMGLLMMVRNITIGTIGIWDAESLELIG